MHDPSPLLLNQPLATSTTLGWDGMVVESVVCPPGTMTSQPRPDLMVCMALSQTPEPIIQTHQGRRHTGVFSRGAAQVVSPGSVGTWSHDTPFEHMNVFLPRSVLVRSAEDLVAGNPENVEVSNQFETKDEVVEHLCLALLAELHAGGISGRLYRDSLVQALASRLVRLFGTGSIREPKSTSRPALLGRILDYIEVHLDRDLSLDELSAEAGMSRNYFVTVFSQSLGMPPHRYLLERRIDRACTLLAGSSLPVADIAVATGFYDQSHLARHLRRRHGRSPTDLRNRKNVL